MSEQTTSKPTLTLEDVHHVAHLARLELSEQEIPPMLEELKQILTYIACLDEIATRDVEPTSHASGHETILRSDHPQDSLSKREILRNAPSSSSEGFLVPKVL